MYFVDRTSKGCGIVTVQPKFCRFSVLQSVKGLNFLKKKKKGVKWKFARARCDLFGVFFFFFWVIKVNLCKVNQTYLVHYINMLGGQARSLVSVK